MLKYAEVIDKNGKCNVALGDDLEFYKSIGMKKMEVERSDIDNQWYLKEKCPQKTNEQKIDEKIYILNKLSMTKLDFYKKILLPYGITYDKLNEILELNPDYKIAWNLCEKVYRGDEILVGALKKYIPTLSEDDLNIIFKGD